MVVSRPYAIKGRVGVAYFCYVRAHPHLEVEEQEAGSTDGLERSRGDG